MKFNDSNKDKTKKEEGEKILKFLEKKNRAEIFILHEKGSEYDSNSFAKVIKENEGKEITFVIGGSLGFSEEVLKKYPKQISLSKMTFLHEMAKVILIEQIYRAITILKNKSYHY